MKHFRKYSSMKSVAGVALVMVIVMMLVVALLGAGILALFSTSSFNQVEAQKDPKAYYLSESGIRVVAGEFHAQTTIAGQNTVLVNLQGKTFNLPNNDGSFTLQIFPYWFYVNSAYAANSTPIVLYFPGKIPPINTDGGSTLTALPAPGILKLRGNTKVGVFTSATVGSLGANGTPVTFSGICYYGGATCSSTGFPYAISAGDEMYFGYVYNSPTTQPVNMGGDLVFTDPNHTAAIFPPVNGNIIIIQRPGQYDEYTYQSRIPQVIDPSNPPTSFTLHYIQKATSLSYDSITINYMNGPCTSQYDVNCTTQIYLGKTLGVQSSSEYVN